MTIMQLRQEAIDLRDLAVQAVSGVSISLDYVWRRLAELFNQVRHVLAKRADGFTLEGVSPSWDEVSNRANHVIRACDVVEPPPSIDIPGGYGA